jgi:hypothetical protein
VYGEDEMFKEGLTFVLRRQFEEDRRYESITKRTDGNEWVIY